MTENTEVEVAAMLIHKMRQ